MAATLEQIKHWFEKAVSAGATHMLIVTDTFTYEDHPVFVFPDDNVNNLLKTYDEVPMTKVQEIYNISLGWETQRSPRKKAWNI